MQLRILICVVLTGCGRSALMLDVPAGDDGDTAIASDSDSDEGVTAIEVSIDAPSTALPLTRVRATATVTNAANQQVTWSSDPATAATIDADGVFVAPELDGDYIIRATSVADPSVSAMTTIRVTRALTPAVAANTGTITNGTGMAHQNHLVHAVEHGEWWLWYETSEDTTHLRTRRSTDFITWNEGASLSLGKTHGNDARNIAIADRIINGNHVVHISVGFIDSDLGRKHVRATLPGGSCVFGAAVQTNTGGSTEPDGPAVVITDAGQVVDGSGWDQTPQTPPLTPCGDGDVEIYVADALETGTTSFDAMTYTKQVIWCVDVRVNARVLLSDGETLYHIYDNGGKDPTPKNFFFSLRRADGTWLPVQDTYTPPPEVFASAVETDINDWNARIIGAQIHAVRRNGSESDTLEHRIFTLGSEDDWAAGQPIDLSASTTGSGVYLTPYGEGALLVQIAADQLVYSFWDGDSWSPWNALDVPSGTRSFIAGSTPPTGNERPAVMWMETETATGASVIVGSVLP